MPTLTRWFIKTALIYFITALALGVAMQSRFLIEAMPFLGAFWPGYLHLLMVGWITGFIFGVAYWLFPRPNRSRPAPSAGPGWIAYGCLNGGLLLRVIAEPVTALHPATAFRWLLPVSGILQFAAACAFAMVIWPRVKAR